MFQQEKECYSFLKPHPSIQRQVTPVLQTVTKEQEVSADDVIVKNVVDELVTMVVLRGMFFDRHGYRAILSDGDYDDSDSDSSSLSSNSATKEDSEDSDSFFCRILEKTNEVRFEEDSEPPKTRGELDIKDLPPIEKLSISVPEDVQMLPAGKVKCTVDCLVIVESYSGACPLDADTVLFTADKTAVGQIFETLGPVACPLYSMRYNHKQEIENLHLAVGTCLFFIPQSNELTKKVFVDELKTVKGSDASWENNNEPPEHIRYFSDDEEERQWKNRFRRSCDGRRKINTVDVTAVNDDASNATKQQKQRPCGNRNNVPWNTDFHVRADEHQQFAGIPHQSFSSSEFQPSHPTVPSAPRFGRPPYMRPQQFQRFGVQNVFTYDGQRIPVSNRMQVPPSQHQIYPIADENRRFATGFTQKASVHISPSFTPYPVSSPHGNVNSAASGTASNLNIQNRLDNARMFFTPASFRPPQPNNQ